MATFVLMLGVEGTPRPKTWRPFHANHSFSSCPSQL